MADNNFPLRTILWETTLRCNAYCEFCGSRCGDVKPENELTTEEICNTFKHIAEKYDATKIMIDVTGGEPLVREDIFDVMSYAASLGFSWVLVTNGTLITKEIVDKLKNSGMKTISISIDGLADTHNNIRRVKNGFQKIENALHMLHDADFVETVMINCFMYIMPNSSHDTAFLRSLRSSANKTAILHVRTHRMAKNCFQTTVYFFRLLISRYKPSVKAYKKAFISLITVSAHQQKTEQRLKCLCSVGIFHKFFSLYIFTNYQTHESLKDLLSAT